MNEKMPATIEVDQDLQRQKSCSGSCAEKVGNGRQPMRSPMSRLFDLILSWSYREPRLYVSLLEWRSFLCRIRLALGSESYRNRYKNWFDLGPFAESSNGGHQICKRTQQRKQDMQKIFHEELHGVNPNALHLQLFFLGWNCGEEWANKCHGIDNIPPDCQSGP